MILLKQKSVHSTKPLWLAFLRTVVLILAFGLGCNVVNAAIDVYKFDTPQQEEQYRHLIEEFRCPKCQNQNLAGSDSVIAEDLKRKTYEMVKAGQTDAQIRDYMTERYGDFISYKPPVRPSTWILWFFPPLFLAGLIGWWLWRNARMNKAAMVGVDVNTTQTNSVSTADSKIVTDYEVQNMASPDSTDNEALDTDLTAQEAEALSALLTKYDDDNSNDDSNKNL